MPTSRLHPPICPPSIHAWTGGDFLPLPQDIPLARALYRAALRDYREYWHSRPTPDTRLILKNRAIADAYATRRFHLHQQPQQQEN